MADFSLQDLWWLKPKEQDNPLPALQLGVSIAQHKAQRDLQERELGNQIARTSLMREELMYKQQIQTQLTEGNAKIAEAIAGVTDWTDPEQVKRVYGVGAQYPMVVGGKAWLGAEHMEQNAKAAKARSIPDVGTAESVVTGVDEAGNPITENFVRFGNRIFRSTQEHVVTDTKSGKRYIRSGTGAIHMLDDKSDVEITTNPNTGEQFVQALPILDKDGNQIGSGYRGSKGNIVRLPGTQMRLMTDVESAERKDLLAERKEAVTALESINSGKVPEPAHGPLGIFGTSKAVTEQYSAQTNKIAAIDAKLEALKAKAEARALKVTREGLKTAPPPTTQPVPVAPPEPNAPESTIRRQGGNLFQQQPDGTWKFIGAAQ